MKKSCDIRGDIFKDDDPIQVRNLIQPHGVLFILDQTTLRILNGSANTANVLGLQPSQLMGQPLTSFLSATQITTIEQQLPMAANYSLSLELTLTTPEGTRPFHGFIHQTSDAVLLELEPFRAASCVNGRSVTTQIRDVVGHLQRAESLDRLLITLVNDLRSFTGYHRVMVYQFDHQGAGEVIAEAKEDTLTPYLGLRFPAHDIPMLFRDIYARGKLRTIPDIAAIPVPLFIADSALQPSIDLRLSVLHSPSPCCAEYYRNMGVNASLVASLIKDGQLWGLISCHHITSKYISYEVRAGCEIIAQMAAAELANQMKRDELQQQMQLTTLNSKLIAAISQAETFLDALTHPEKRLLDLVNATGVALVLGDELVLVGTTPSPNEIGALLQWADREIEDTLFHTNRLSQFYPEAENFLPTGSGLLRLHISKTPCYQMLWFRTEVVQTVTWAGNPDKHFTQDAQGTVKLSPRSSFEHWKETVYGQSLPWQSFELNAALDLRNAIIGIVLKKTDELTRLNRQLEQRNRELSSFAYAAAHDLKEPLRGIYNYSNVLIEDYGQALDADGKEYLEEMQGFAQHMEALLNGLLRISQLRQADLHIESVDLNQVIENVVSMLQASQPDIQFEVQLPRILPQLDCDEILITEVFSNLIGNAIKYNDKPAKWVEIGYRESGPGSETVFYIRDNGIGIQDKHRPVIFKLFKRLHPQDFYGGGAGIGLAVTHQIIERHNGKIWVESTPAQGSTFFFRVKQG